MRKGKFAFHAGMISGVVLATILAIHLRSRPGKLPSATDPNPSTSSAANGSDASKEGIRRESYPPDLCRLESVLQGGGEDEAYIPALIEIRSRLESVPTLLRELMEYVRDPGRPIVIRSLLSILAGSVAGIDLRRALLEYLPSAPSGLATAIVFAVALRGGPGIGDAEGWKDFWRGAFLANELDAVIAPKYMTRLLGGSGATGGDVLPGAEFHNYCKGVWDDPDLTDGLLLYLVRGTDNAGRRAVLPFLPSGRRLGLAAIEAFGTPGSDRDLRVRCLQFAWHAGESEAWKFLGEVLMREREELLVATAAASLINVAPPGKKPETAAILKEVALSNATSIEVGESITRNLSLLENREAIASLTELGLSSESTGAVPVLAASALAYCSVSTPLASERVQACATLLLAPRPAVVTAAAESLQSLIEGNLRERIDRSAGQTALDAVRRALGVQGDAETRERLIRLERALANWLNGIR